VYEEDGKPLVRLVKELRKRDYRPTVPEIGIDLGLNPLFATDRGSVNQVAKPAQPISS